MLVWTKCLRGERDERKEGRKEGMKSFRSKRIQQSLKIKTKNEDIKKPK